MCWNLILRSLSLLGLLVLGYSCGETRSAPPSQALPVQTRAVQASAVQTPFRQWGVETFKDIDAAFFMPQRNLYADEAKLGQPVSKTPAFMWGGGVQLAALAGATHVDRKTYEPLLRRYSDALQSYWSQAHDIGGYDVWPMPKPSDRYYDDNQWVVLALAEGYEATGDKVYLERAEATQRFVMSGEDDKLGGGIYWRENEKTSKNTCSNAPAAAAALRLYQLTRKREYLDSAQRIYAWTNQHLQDKDALFFDNVKLDGKIEETKWSYNSALMIRTNCLLYAVTRDRKYLTEAQRIARAAEQRWIQPDTGAIKDEAHFAHLLSEAFLFLYEQDHDKHWPELVQRALIFLHTQARDANGHYGKRWDTLLKTPLESFRLIDQASAARAYWVAARFIK